MEPTYDPHTRTAHIGGLAVSLTDKEGAAFAYLCDRLGQVVPRAELEREVWQMAPGVRSETVPVTLRTLRRKITPGDASPLVTVRGVGWRLDAPPRPLVATLPRFATPYVPRIEAEASLDALLDAGWRCVTVTGPAGSGKTRLAVTVAGRLDGPVVFAAVGAARSPADVAQSVLSAAGVNATDLSDLAQALPAHDLIVVLDEAELAWDAVREAVLAAPDVRFLVTSRRGLELPCEAVFQIPPLVGEAGATFLRGRLAAARWGGRPAGDVVARAVQLLDGLPLALELAAFHPSPLHDLVEILERGDLPTGPEVERLTATLQSSLEPLSDPQRDLLHALALCEGPLQEPELVRWLGDDAPARVRELAARSLLEHRGTGWALPRILRTYLRQQPAEWADLQATFDTFLTQRVRAWGEELCTTPRATLSRLGPLLPDVHALLERVDVDQLPALCWVLQHTYETWGPRVGARRLLDVCERRLPGHPLTVLLTMLQLGPTGRPIPRVAEDADPHLRVLEVLQRSDYDRSSLSLPQLDRLLESLPEHALSLRYRTQWLRAMVLERTRPDEARDLLVHLTGQAADAPLHHTETLRRLAIAWRYADRFEAVRVARRATSLARQHGLPILEFRCRWVLGSLLGEDDPWAGAAAFEESAARVRRACPQEADALRSAAGLLYFALGEDDRALPNLEAGMRYPSRHVSDVAAAIRAAIHLRRDDPRGRSLIERLPPESVLLFRADQSSAGADLKAVLAAEITLHEARLEGRELEGHRAVVAALEDAAREDDPALLRLARDHVSHRLRELEARHEPVSSHSDTSDRHSPS